MCRIITKGNECLREYMYIPTGIHVEYCVDARLPPRARVKGSAGARVVTRVG